MPTGVGPPSDVPPLAPGCALAPGAAGPAPGEALPGAGEPTNDGSVGSSPPLSDEHAASASPPSASNRTPWLDREHRTLNEVATMLPLSRWIRPAVKTIDTRGARVGVRLQKSRLPAVTGERFFQRSVTSLRSRTSLRMTGVPAWRSRTGGMARARPRAVGVRKRFARFGLALRVPWRTACRCTLPRRAVSNARGSASTGSRKARLDGVPRGHALVGARFERRACARCRTASRTLRIDRVSFAPTCQPAPTDAVTEPGESLGTVMKLSVSRCVRGTSGLPQHVSSTRCLAFGISTGRTDVVLQDEVPSDGTHGGGRGLL